MAFFHYTNHETIFSNSALELMNIMTVVLISHNWGKNYFLPLIGRSIKHFIKHLCVLTSTVHTFWILWCLNLLIAINDSIVLLLVQSVWTHKNMTLSTMYLCVYTLDKHGNK